MTSEARPQAAMAAVDRLQVLALVRAAAASPTLVVGGAVVLWFAVSAMVLKLDLTSASPFAIALLSALASGVVARTLGHAGARDAEGPFGFVLTRRGQRLGVAARRSGPMLAAGWVAFAALAAWVRPDALAPWLPAAASGLILGGAVGVLLSAFVPASSDRGIRVSGRGVRFNAVSVGLILATALVLAAARMSTQGGAAGAQIVATLAVGAAVLPTLTIDPRRLTLQAQTPLSMAQLLLPGLARPALTAGAAALTAAVAISLSAPVALGLTLALALLAALVRLFLTLAALGRSERTAATAGWVELAVAGLLPTAGPAAIGPLAGLWVMFRLAWLWRRAVRVRWLDAGEG